MVLPQAFFYFCLETRFGLVVGLGLNWREIKGQCITKLAWKTIMAEAIVTVLQAWGIKSLKTAVPESPIDLPSKRPKPNPAEDPPIQPWIDQDVEASSISGWILLVTDNQSLANVLNGAEEYRGGDEITRRSLIASTNHLGNIVEHGWQTRDVRHDYILWRPRELNTLADYLANVAMDRSNSSEWTWDRVQHIKPPYSLQIFTDGGRRNDASASAAWAIFTMRKDEFKLVGTGNYFMHAPDSFRTEALAIEAALSHLSRIRAIMGHPPQLQM